MAAMPLMNEVHAKSRPRQPMPPLRKAVRMSASAPLLTGKNRRRALQALIAAPLLALGIAAGSGIANPASAATGKHLCLNNITFDRCIYASGANGAELADSTTPGMTNWTYPALGAPAAYIQQGDNVNRCLQLDYSKKDSAGMPTVIGAACVNDDAEKWVNVYDSIHSRTMFESEWTIKNLGGPLCLYGDPSHNNLAIFDCDPGYGQIAALEDWSNS
jgi:hypothetical protein